MDRSKIIAAILTISIVSFAASYYYFKGEQSNFSDVITDTYRAVADIQSDLSVSAGNLSPTDSETRTETFIRTLNSSKEILLKANKSLNTGGVSEKFSDDNKKLLECLKTEYNLMNRWKESLSMKNEYEAWESFIKSKDLMFDLKEKSAMLAVDGNFFEDIFDLSSAYEKIEKFLAARKQLRYEKDLKEQAVRDKAAEAERAKQQVAEEESRRKAQAGRSPLGYHWIQDNNAGVYLYNPQPTDGETVFWSGGWVQDGDYKFANGRGTVTWKKYGRTTQIDEGSFVHGRHNGQFKHTFPISGRVEYSFWDHGVEVR